MVELTVCVHYVTLCDVSGPFTLRGLHVTLFNRVESCFKGKATLFIYLHKSALLADFFFLSTHTDEMTSCPWQEE